MMDIGMKVQILRACSSKKGNRCSSCPAFGQGDRNCSRNAMKDAATALSTLQAENAQLRADLEYEREHADAYYEECGQWEAENEKPRVEAEGMRSNWYKSVEEIKKLRAELEQVKAGRDAAIEYLREIEWCAGCKHFGGLDGCKKWAMGQCTEKHDLYEFIGPQKED